MKKYVDLYEYAPHILTCLNKGGILVTTKVDEIVNPITVAWLTIGQQWNKQIIQIYIRHTRYTKALLDTASDFTLNIPMEMNEQVRAILKVCGTTSGKDTNKIEVAGIHLNDSKCIVTPGIKELPLTIECKIIYKQMQDAFVMPEDVLQRYYPNYKNEPEDVHTVYYGEVLASYIIE